MKTLVKAVREQWETCTDVENAMRKYLNFNKGQLRYFHGGKEEMVLVMAAESLKQQGVTARCLEDPTFEDIVDAIKEIEDTEDVPETERSEK